MAGTFTAKLNAAVRKRIDLIEETYRRSAQDVAAVAQVPGPSVANPDASGGGRMPIDSGFLRASMTAVIGGPLPSKTYKPAGEAKYSFDGSAMNLVISGATVADEITVAWTANYARFVNHRYRFRDLAAQQWPQIVKRNAAEVSKEAGL